MLLFMNMQYYVLGNAPNYF